MGEGGIMSNYLARLKEIESEKKLNVSSVNELTKLTEVLLTVLSVPIR